MTPTTYGQVQNPNQAPVSSYPGWQGANAQGGFHTPTTIQPSAIDAVGNFFGGIGSSIGNGVQSALQGAMGMFNQPAVYQSTFRQPGPQQVIHVPGDTPPPSPAATAMPAPVQTQSQAAPADLNNFHFQMGQHDYSSLGPQVKAMLGNSPLAQYYDNFMQAANQYGVDPRLLPLIANNESSMGKNYPTISNNPFGYVVNPNGNVNQGLINAGFTSIPMAIDKMTNRFVRPGTPQGYADFRANPTIPQLQQTYNATPNEANGWVANAQAQLPMMQAR